MGYRRSKPLKGFSCSLGCQFMISCLSMWIDIGVASSYVNCASCHGDWEDMAHILWGWPQANDVWSFLENKGFQCRALNMNVATWIKENTRLQKEDPSWPTKFLVTCWYLWKWRIAVCFESSNHILEHKGSFLLTKFEILAALSNQSQMTGRPENVRVEWSANWETPPSEWVLLNIDGAAKGNLGPAACFGVLRSDREEWLGVFTESLGWCSSLKAELKATYNGLKLARELRLNKVWVQSDSRTVMEMLKGHFAWCLEHI